MKAGRRVAVRWAWFLRIEKREELHHRVRIASKERARQMLRHFYFWASVRALIGCVVWSEVTMLACEVGN